MFEAARLEFPLVEPLTEFTADRTTAMIIGVSLGGVVYEETLGGQTYARGVRKLRLQLEPFDEPPYEAELTLDPDETMVPMKPGTRMPVLVDREDPRNLALPEFNRWFALPGGIVWQPPTAEY
jgi:hypothetical protein